MRAQGISFGQGPAWSSAENLLNFSEFGVGLGGVQLALVDRTTHVAAALGGCHAVFGREGIAEVLLPQFLVSDRSHQGHILDCDTVPGCCLRKRKF
jgi:hypothetical protein